MNREVDLGSHCLSELREQGGGPGLSLPIRAKGTGKSTWALIAYQS